MISSDARAGWRSQQCHKVIDRALSTLRAFKLHFWCLDPGLASVLHAGSFFSGALDACSGPPDSSWRPSSQNTASFVAVAGGLQGLLWQAAHCTLLRPHLRFQAASGCSLVTTRVILRHDERVWRRGARTARLAPLKITCVARPYRRRRAALMPLDAHEHCHAVVLEAWQSLATRRHEHTLPSLRPHPRKTR